MSNHLAVATVSATLRQVIQKAIVTDVPDAGATAVIGRPPGPSQNPNTWCGVTLYLYRVSSNIFLRNDDLPTRSPNGQRLLQRPQVALLLDYIISFYGDESRLVPQRLLGSVVRALHIQPILPRWLIQDTVEHETYLAGSNLADQLESVKFTPVDLSLEELTKLWSVFIQTPHALSLTYQASVVLINTDDEIEKSPPVRRINLNVQPTVLEDGDASLVVEFVKASLLVKVSPAIEARLPVALRLNETGAPPERPPRTYRIEAPPAETARSEIIFALPEVTPGTYRVSLEVGEAGQTVEFAPKEVSIP